ncbi:hypothetical protein G6722_08705 [Polynucleobacter paneuropaeus]|nr:hypothetical protein [Polynucleobacter paneuropaeus]
MNIKNIIGLIEKLFLIIIAIFTITAMAQEILSTIANHHVEFELLSI